MIQKPTGDVHIIILAVFYEPRSIQTEGRPVVRSYLRFARH